VIDIFAGPGGLGEGFSAITDKEKKRVFDISLSVEKDEHAHKTLTLRSFFRQFEKGNVPKDYYEFIKGNITLNDLYAKWPKEAEYAAKEAWHATLGDTENAISNKTVDKRIEEALKGKKNWLLIGGPPCQAYSVVGRSRRQEKILDETKDERVGLYKQYLRILAIHNPAVFVMENVKGLLSAETKESPVFTKILKDLSDPVAAYLQDFKKNGQELNCPGYKIYSLVSSPKEYDLEGNPVFNQKDFIIRAEKYGIPQTRHRVILLGIRKDKDILPYTLHQMDEVPVSKVLSGLPRLRSGLSKRKDNGEDWRNIIEQITKRSVLTGIDSDIKEEIAYQTEQLRIPHQGTGAEYIPSSNVDVDYRPDWYLDKRIEGVCNHISRGHMDSDLLRYFFAACFARIKKTSPKLGDFPESLLPDHKNVKEGIEEKKFADRFRVQLSNQPSKTVTSHISKDGHYYIHYDPTQCRSFSVREAARIQTFPDNYYFCGGRTQQFHQVGNAVPPLLASKIAAIVHKIFLGITNSKLTSTINEYKTTQTV
jgi:DNA (cytosine-5)-methyltransferase 1